MLIARDWADHDDLQNAVTNALEAEGLDVRASDEEDSYRNHGTVVVNVDGKRFYLQLWEEQW